MLKEVRVEGDGKKEIRKLIVHLDCNLPLEKYRRGHQTLLITGHELVAYLEIRDFCGMLLYTGKPPTPGGGALVMGNGATMLGLMAEDCCFKAAARLEAFSANIWACWP